MQTFVAGARVRTPAARWVHVVPPGLDRWCGRAVSAVVVCSGLSTRARPVIVPRLAWWVLLLLAVVGAEILVLAFFRGARNVSRAERHHAVAEARRQARKD
jgi:hypothetical protein